MNVRQSVNEGQFYVFRRVSSQWVALFYAFVELRAFALIFIVVTLFPLRKLQE